MRGVGVFKGFWGFGVVLMSLFGVVFEGWVVGSWIWVGKVVWLSWLVGGCVELLVS